MNTIPDRTVELAEIHREVFPAKPQPVPKPSAQTAPAMADDQKIIDKVIADPKWARLWSGDFSAQGSQSQGDLALCGRIAFFTGHDPARIDSIFRQSGLTREKWDRSDYREPTIAMALAGKTEFYDWNRPAKESFASQSDGDQPQRYFELSELGMAERVYAAHGSKFRYVGPFKKFIVWDGKRSNTDDTGSMDRLVKRTIRDTKVVAAGMHGDAGELLYKHAHSCETNSRIKAIIERISRESGVAISVDDLDRDPMLLNVGNGTLDLRTGKLHPHDPGEYITKLANVRYDPAALCPTFDLFMDRITAGNEQVAGYMRRALGYSITGNTGERCLFMPWGGGANGKSTLIHTISEILGDYSTTLPAESLMVQRGGGIPNDIARLNGARFVSAVETEENRRLAESLVKTMTGGADLLTARFLYGEYFSFRPQFKLWIGTNHRPVIRGTDQAIWDRIKLLPFTVRIPEDERDTKLPDKLRAEYAGILAWLVRGCLEWQEHGLDAPNEVRTAVDGYRAEMDVLGQFIEECCIVGDRLMAGATPLFDAYKIWSQLHNEDAMTQRRFGSQLGERGFISATDSITSRRLWRGIGLKANSEATL